MFRSCSAAEVTLLVSREEKNFRCSITFNSFLDIGIIKSKRYLIVILESS